MATIYKRGKTWWIGYRVAGRNVCHSLKTQNGRVAEEMRTQYEALKTNGLIPKPSVTSIGPFMQALCEFCRKTRRGKGAENDIGRLRCLFGPCCDALKMRPHTPYRFRQERTDTLKLTDMRSGGYLPVKKLEDLTSRAIAAHLHDRIVRGEITGKTANNYRAVLSGMFSYARKYHGYVCPEPDYRNPIEGVDRFDETNHPILWLKDDDIAKQLQALADHPTARSLVATYIYAGLRRSEALWLTIDDIDLSQRVIRVRVKTVEGERWMPKTGKDRTVPIGTKLLAELTTYMSHQRGVWVFPSLQGKRWDADNFSDHLRAINKAAGLPWSCIEFRHTFGSHLAQKGISLYKISEMMGNSPDICRKHYAALMPQEMHDEVEF